MRNPSRVLLLVLLITSLIVPPLPLAGAAKLHPASAPAPKRVMLVGDSLAVGLGQQLAAVLKHTPGVTFSHLGKVSSGLANPAFFNWEAHLTAMVRENHPDVVLMLFGANDNKPLAENGRSLAFGTPAWNRAYAGRLGRMVAIVRGENSKARIFVLGVPVMANPAFNAEMTRVNAVLAAAVKTLPGTTFVATTDVLADARGAFAAEGVHANGTKVRLRAKDGVHISATGSRLLAARCLEAVASAADLNAPAVLATVADLDVRPMGATAPVQLAAASPRSTRTSAAAADQGAGNRYTVVDGDTLWSVSQRLGLTQAQLIQSNPGIDPDRLTIGQRLAIPASVTQLAGAAPSNGVGEQLPATLPSDRNYTVAAGDNFWTVARASHVSVADLTRVNPGVDPTRLQIGQKLAIPVSHESVTTADATPEVDGPGYTVAEGDNFWTIAHRLGVDMAALRQANAKVDPLRLHPGQVLALPASPVASADGQPASRESAQSAVQSGLYPVAPGDTLWGLSRRFGVSLDTMLSVNGEVDPNRLQVGQLVTIPGVGQPVASNDAMLFPVSAGDTLWAIARRFGVSVAALTAANPGIDPLRLQAGQTLCVPSSLAAVSAPGQKPEPEAATARAGSGQPGRLHSVVTGDTLWRLARRFGVSFAAMLRENAGIDPDHLQVGQTVRLPDSRVSMAAR